MRYEYIYCRLVNQTHCRHSLMIVAHLKSSKVSGQRISPLNKNGCYHERVPTVCIMLSDTPKISTYVIRSRVNRPSSISQALNKIGQYLQQIHINIEKYTLLCSNKTIYYTCYIILYPPTEVARRHHCRKRREAGM